MEGKVTVTVKSQEEVSAELVERFAKGTIDRIIVLFPDGTSVELLRPTPERIAYSAGDTWGEVALREFPDLARGTDRQRQRQRLREELQRPFAKPPRRRIPELRVGFGATLGSAPSAEPARMASPPPPPPPSTPPPPEKTVKTSLQGAFEGHDASQPLEVGSDYVFAFWATDIPTANAAFSVGVDLKFEESQTSVKLTIQLLSDDFEIQQPSQDLFIGRDGKSRGKARFDLRPKRAGACTLDVLVLRDGNFVQKLTIPTTVGTMDGPQVGPIEVVGRTFTADEKVQPRQVVIVIQQEVGGLRFFATKDGAISGRLKISDAELDSLVNDLRTQLQETVELFDDESKSFIYQKSLEIPPKVHAQALEKLADAGTFLFKTLFVSGPAVDEGMKAIGRMLQQSLGGEPLDVQIVTERFFVPWSLLYISGKAGEPLDAHRFLGFAHRVEEVALQTHDARPPEIVPDTSLKVGFYVNKSIDTDMEETFVADQIEFFDSIAKTKKATVTTRDTTAAVLSALTDANVTDQLMYFYCHARSASLTEGVASAAIEIEPTKSITLRTLRNKASGDPFRSTPLIFINACQSAKLSPLFYDGFVPELTSRGARGVVGTECDTPAIFAAAWAKRFLHDFMNGKELGRVVFDLRRRFLEDNNNMMGLLYAVHCNGNTRVDPALGLTAA